MLSPVVGKLSPVSQLKLAILVAEQCSWPST